MPDPRTMDYTICDIINSTLSRGDLETLSAVPNEVSGGTSSCNVGHSRSRGSDGSLGNEGKGCGKYNDIFDGRVCQELEGADRLPFFRHNLDHLPNREL